MIAPVGRVAARVVLLMFCWMTTVYAFIASSAFAYLQFIKPRVFRWVGTFSDWHPALSWIWFGVLVLYLWPELRTRSRARQLAIGLVACAGGLVIANTFGSIVPRLSDGNASIVAGVAVLVPLIWLAIIDHVAAWTQLTARSGARDEREWQQQDGRLCAACLGSAVLLTGGYAGLASISIANAFEPDLLTMGLAVGTLSSLLGHLLVAGTVFASLALLLRVGGTSLERQYFLLLGAVSVVLSVVFAHFVGDPMGLRGRAATAAALAMGVSIAATWGGMRLRAHQRAGRTSSSGLDLFLSTPSAHQKYRLIVPLVAVLPLAWGFELLASRIDWDFALLKTGVIIVWVLTFALVYRAAPLRRIGTAVAILPFALAIAAYAAWHPSELQQHARDRYAVHNPSFRVTDGLLRERPKAQSFERYLRANTGLTDVTVAPVSIDLAAPSASAVERPYIFLFVVDSLRADYLSPYNREVRFTPRIDAFARENVALRNAFTRYGGTGLSMPALWAGSVLAHKQYVLPFTSMNALEKLVDANGYRRVQTHDHITQALWANTDSDAELDRGRTEMDFDFCRTVDELGARLESDRADPRPVFAQTRSLNLHVAAVRNGYVPPGKSYPGFEPPYAYRVERIDSCFGSFIDRLKQLRLYDRSLVVLTADHGELIGEDGRWGHSYHLFPQVVRIPLFIHLPRSVAGRSVDSGAVSLSTDITPTLYAALGVQPTPPDVLAGHSLFDASLSLARRRTPVVLSASYGAVYAVLSGNGRRLYIADAIQEQEYAYERRSADDVQWAQVGVDPGRRMLEQLRIRRHVDTIARTYGFDRPF